MKRSTRAPQAKWPRVVRTDHLTRAGVPLVQPVPDGYPAPDPAIEHARYLAAHYRLLRNVALWLLSQPEVYMVPHAGREVWATSDGMIEHARDWWDMAHVVWYAARAAHDEHGDCLCPSCTEQQYPQLKETTT